MSGTMQKRRKRFVPTPTQQYVNLNDRDLLILKSLWKHRFLTTEQIYRLTGSPSLQVVQRRMRTLFDYEFIERPPSQVSGGNASMVYGLGLKGARHLEDQNLTNGEGLRRWKDRNAAVGRFHLKHTIDTAEQLIGFEIGCRNHASIRFLDDAFILERGAPKLPGSAHPLTMKTSITWGDKIEPVSVVPDGLFGLYAEGASERDRVSFFCLELDEGTMPIVASSFRQSSILKKMLAYASVIRNRVHTKRFSIEAFRVLFVTTSPQRVANMQAAYSKHIRKLIQPGFFLFATKAQLAGTNPLLQETVLQTASGAPFLFDPAERKQADAA